MKSLIPLCLSLIISLPVSAEPIFKEINGADIPLSSLKGKWVMINYWASWCQPCLDEIPELNQLYNEHKDNLTVFAVNYDAHSIRKQQKLIKKYNIEYPSLINDPAKMLRLGDITGVPMTFVFDPKGELSDTLYGGQTMDALMLSMNLEKNHFG